MTTHSLSTSISRSLIALAGLGTFLFMLVAQGCSASATCDDSKCAAGNKCIDDGKSVACRLQCDTQSACPFNFHCTAAKTKTAATYCAADGAKYSQRDKGQWGAHCDSHGGLDSNPDCASDQNFWCFGQTPTDADAYCTQYQCGSDADCAGGYWCATINTTPDVRTANRSNGAMNVTTVCKKRDYCAPCANDVDCPSIEGVKSHCVDGGDGVTVCTTECMNDGNCNPDAKCDQSGSVADSNVCLPRAGTCKGDGSFCSPCRSDADCPMGYCIKDAYSKEQYCSVASTTPCTVDVNNKLHATCPAAPAETAGVSCEPTKNNITIPQNQCYGLVKDSIGGKTTGCWTVNKK